MEQSKFYQIKNVTEHEYTLVGCDGSVITRPIQDVDKTASVFTIQDAKDGDILCYKEEISLYKHDIAKCTTQKLTFGGFTYHCCYDGKRFIMDNLYSLTEQDKMDIHPATKEQRDFLFQKMKEAGYEWDAKNKKLKKIESKPTDNVENLTDVENSILNFADHFHSNRCKPESEWVDEIKMLRDYIPSYILKSTKWSEEDETKLTNIIIMLKEGASHHFIKDDITKAVDWLKSLRPQNVCSYNPYKAVVESITKMCEKYKGYVCAKEVANDFLNNVFAKCHEAVEYDKKYPQKQWKPSEEQMRALEQLEEMHVLGCEKTQENAHLYVIIKSLKEQLKNL